MPEYMPQDAIAAKARASLGQPTDQGGNGLASAARSVRQWLNDEVFGPGRRGREAARDPRVQEYGMLSSPATMEAMQQEQADMANFGGTGLMGNAGYVQGPRDEKAMGIGMDAGAALPIAKLYPEPKSFFTRVAFKPDNIIEVRYPGFGYESTGELREEIVRQAADGLKPELDWYYRFTNNPKEIDIANSGKIRTSKNHRDGFRERGVSVSKGPHYGIWGYDLGYKAKGDIIDYGSDGEPLLRPKTFTPVSDYMDLLAMDAEYRSLRDAHLRGIGWTPEAYKDVIGGRINFETVR